VGDFGWPSGEMPENAKIAFINTDRETPHKSFTIFAGIITDINIKYFINHDEAISWLCEG